MGKPVWYVDFFPARFWLSARLMIWLNYNWQSRGDAAFVFDAWNERLQDRLYACGFEEIQ